MVRPEIPPNKRKQTVSMSLSPSALVILSNLAKASKKNRSQVVEEMLNAKGFNDLGLKATAQHTTMVQRWRPRGKEDDPGACNPYHNDGKCVNDACQALYKKWGL
jgi:hypothetical protein